MTGDPLSAISAITPSGELYLVLQEQPFDSQTVIAFLQQLLAHIPGKLLIIWDGAPIHLSKAIQAFLRQQANGRIWLERLPGYAPDLNPDEGIWHYLKQVELKNRCCHNLAHLKQEQLAAELRLRQKPPIIQACFAHAGY